MRPARRLLLLSLTLLLAGCAFPGSHSRSDLSATGPLLSIAQTIEQSGCRNSAYPHPADLPYLRSSRFWQAELQKDLAPAALVHLLNQLRLRDRHDRRTEIDCLPDTQLDQLAQLFGLETADPETVDRFYQFQAEAHLKAALADPDPLLQRLRAYRVPDDYSLGLRTIGLYPLSQIPFAIAIDSAYAERHRWFAASLETWLNEGSWQRYRPEQQPGETAESIAELLARSRDNPLNIPLPDPEQEQRLATYFAPIIVQQQQLLEDRWGAVEIDADHNIQIDDQRPQVYYYLDHGAGKNGTLLRINYVTWYPARAGEQTPWFEKGWLDGLTIGISLQPDGSILLLQTMNNCACYLQGFPALNSELAPYAHSDGPDPLIPQRLPERLPDQRHAVFVSSGWHQVIRIGTAFPETADYSYRLRPYADLESLPTPTGGRRSMFNPRGIVSGSERPEPYFFFPMGIPDVGAMRQRGRQPITLIGRAHYDDADYLDYLLRPVKP